MANAKTKSAATTKKAGAKRKAPATKAKKSSPKKTTPKKTRAATTKKKATAKTAKAPAKKASAKAPQAAKKKTKKAPARKASAKTALAKAAPPPKRAGMAARVATVEAYLAKIPASMQEAARRFHELVAEIAPDARASIKWGQPVWEHGGPLAFVRPAAKHLTLGFWRGAQLEDAKGVLQGVGNRMRHRKVAIGEKLDEEAIRRFITQAVALNREHGDPTKRGR